ncbi:PTS sugar transporter subunit IIA [Georgenia alba]|uniref:Ascorbate-specific PTS system EIIA component n=1 Tax=Georgenia alba TaxID=2233858 RepID=A0ABW2QCZ1_9MICO
MAVTPGSVPVRAVLDVDAPDWRAAVRAGAELLVELGTADEAYVAACVRSVEENGPYIVLTPGVALAHAQAPDGTTTEGLAAARLAEPVAFGHPSNDPVDVVLAFSSGGSHMAMIKALGTALSGGLADMLRGVGDARAAEELLAGGVRV